MKFKINQIYNLSIYGKIQPVKILAVHPFGTNYIGEYKSIWINYIDLEEGIRQVYNKLKWNK